MKSEYKQILKLLSKWFTLQCSNKCGRLATHYRYSSSHEEHFHYCDECVESGGDWLQHRAYELDQADIVRWIEKMSKKAKKKKASK